jgi:hypothetical protein
MGECGRLSVMAQLALLQHYGAPTRLIDVTFNPWIGLWFAVEQKWKDGLPQPDKDVRLIAIDVTRKIVIAKGGVTKKTLRVGTKNAGAQLTHKWKCTLKKGRYSWSVLATDQAGNAQAVKGGARLEVK